ncbi:Beta-1,3-galactosyl-O-glycosyl-glycoprotein beta-1,6-N-acetylglucosaminyltransferase 4 [Bulinus truncatus]|nr:Beta-1,3-galactosyl-O-glycosyl-glycoprotein beta-1,6-N-acetylglucosaminyltransferase 4 [Bulinus truncatus]
MIRISRYVKKKRLLAVFLLAVVTGMHAMGGCSKMFSFYTKPTAEESWTFQTDYFTGYHNKWVGFPDLLGVDCNKAFSHTSYNSQFPQKVNRTFPDEYIAASRDCEIFRERFGFFRYPATSQEESEFPLAFTILFHQDLDQVVFLLRAIYRPHNVYCLNVDTKSSVEFLEAVRSVARCLPNVFVASKLESIVYAGFSRLMADINCFSDLLKHRVQWKYVINMPGQQFPLRTNFELVKILKSYNGTNDIEGNKDLMGWRILWIHSYNRINNTDRFEVIQSKVLNALAPHGLQVVKGSAYGTFSREFLLFMRGSPVALDLLHWSKNIYSPDEYFWSTLNHAENISVPAVVECNQNRGLT